ncbi:MAG: GNAT family N-acetyltransferase [Cyanobacteria bacterium P01_F01_bin.150]
MEKHYRDFVIRPWQPSDRQAVADLAQTVLAEYDMGFEPDENDWDVVQVETAYWQTGGEFWVVEHNSRIVGSGGYHPCDRTLMDQGDTNVGDMKSVELRKMFLYRDIRGQGLGHYLLTALEKSASEKGFTHIWLETAVRMKAAVKLYEKNGYQQPQNTDVHVQRCDRVYVKPLVA